MLNTRMSSLTEFIHSLFKLRFTPQEKRVILLSTAGHMLECFDITLFGFYASLLASLYFPSDNQLTSLMGSFGAFAAGYFMRPLGGILFGHIGDKYGRTTAYILSILIVSLPSIGIGLLPTYHAIGFAAPILLVIFRLMQGISLGGEYSGAAIFIRELVQESQTGFSGSLLVTMGFSGAVLGTILASFFTLEIFPNWFWRIPFIIGGMVGLLVFIMRVQYFSNIVPNAEIIKKTQSINPLIYVLKNNINGVFSGIGIGMHTTVPFYLGVIYTNTILANRFGLSTASIMLINTLIMCLWITLLPLWGHYSDQKSKIKIMATSAIATAIIAFPSYYLIFNTLSIPLFIITQIFICLSSMPYVAISSSIIPTLFPLEQRYSGSAFSFSLGVAIFGGTAPLFATTLLKFDINHGPAIYLFVSSIFGWLAVKKITMYNKQCL